MDFVYAGIYGSCIGDALGVPFEFFERADLEENPVKTMCGYMRYNQPIGTWSDDTSLSLCLLDSIVHKIDYYDIMDKFNSWYRCGKYTPDKYVFDIGYTTKRAILRYQQGMEPLLCGEKEETCNGNGALMRILPLVFYFYREKGKNSELSKEDFDLIENVASLTHAHPISVIGCQIFISIAYEILGGKGIEKAIRKAMCIMSNYYKNSDLNYVLLNHYKRIVNIDYIKECKKEEIYSSGYVVDTLEAVLWCLLKSHSYRECVLLAVNLGGDTDTIASIAGGIAGIYYGLESIPKEWIRSIRNINLINSVCDKWITDEEIV